MADQLGHLLLCWTAFLGPGWCYSANEEQFLGARRSQAGEILVRAELAAPLPPPSKTVLDLSHWQSPPPPHLLQDQTSQLENELKIFVQVLHQQ